MGVKFLATGSYAPDQVVPNEALARLGCDEEWIVQRTGIKERRHAPPEISTGDMAYEAGMRCLEQAGVSPDDVQLLILSTMTPDYAAPNTSCLLQKRMGIRGACMDINAACSGFLYGMITGSQFVHSGCAKHALVIGADVMSRVANPDDLKTFPLFGDGAGAVLLGAESDPNQGTGIISYQLGADGDTEGWLCVRGGGFKEPITPESVAAKRHFLVMEGRPVFKWAVRMIADSIIEVLANANVKAEEIGLVVLHQANMRIIDAAVSGLGFRPEAVVVNVDRYGNTSAGSIPLALDEAHRAGRIERGDKVLFCGFGAGLSWGACVVQW